MLYCHMISFTYQMWDLKGKLKKNSSECCHSNAVRKYTEDLPALQRMISEDLLTFQTFYQRATSDADNDWWTLKVKLQHAFSQGFSTFCLKSLDIFLKWHFAATINFCCFQNHLAKGRVHLDRSPVSHQAEWKKSFCWRKLHSSSRLKKGIFTELNAIQKSRNFIYILG